MPYIGPPAPNRFVASKAATQFSGDGSTTAFTLDHAVGSDEDILVSVDGVIQEPSVAYAVSNGTTLTFTAAPSSNSGNNIFVYYLFRTVGTVGHPSNNALSATSGTFSAGVSGTTGTFSGVLKTDDTTEATSTTDGSLQTDGGLSVAKDIVAGDDIHLKSDSAQISFGADSEVTLDHTADTGLTLQGSGLNTNFSLLSFHTTDSTTPDFRMGKSASNTVGTFTTTADGEALGQIRFTGQDTNNAARTGASISVNQSGSATGSTCPAEMKFSTTATERMRIFSSGRVGLADGTNPEQSAQLDVKRNSDEIVYFRNNSGVGVKLTAGNQSFSVVSDVTKKENISELDKQQSYDNIKNIRAVTFKFKDIEITDDDGKKTTYVDDKNRIGFIAQDWENKYTQLVNTDKDGVKTLLYTETTPVLLSALQKAQEKIEALEAKVAALESK